jgi:N-acetylated-alpha-linked acidic dipeptidase
MRRLTLLLAFLVVAFAWIPGPTRTELAASPAGETAAQGFSQQDWQAEQQWEAKFKAIPSTDNLREYDKRMSARPHAVGQPYDKDNAEWILANFKKWGLDAHIETFYVLFPTPKERLVEMVAPTEFKAKLEEPTVSVDPTSEQHAEQLPTYNAYSIDGDVTAPLVYVNYGVPADYETLARLGVSVKGAIVIARYGGSWRGIKPKVAAEHGAVGCLIYSDPRDDGYFQGDVFPKGAWRPLEGVQRGSVMRMEEGSGDPLTPGWGATKDAKRLSLKEAKTLTSIPVLPLSYGDAKRLLEALDGPVAPAAWRGALGFTYHVGPGPAKVHLMVKANWDVKPIYDVIARIPGSTYPDEWIIRGNHHDAWVNGAEDPLSGQAPLQEEARAFGELLKQGWRPKRTIIYCAWDGEEPGLLGSTEWAEEHAQELEQHAAVYINSDSNSRGYLEAEGSHTLEEFINGVARDIQDPEKDISVWKRLYLKRIADAREAEEGMGTPAASLHFGDQFETLRELRTRPDLRISALGSGSDYTPFLQHLGIASVNLGYGGEDGGGIYHSIYDDFYWYTHFDDTNFVYGRALAQTAGVAVMRLADADLLPLDFSDFSDTVSRYADELQRLADRERAGIIERNREIDEGVYSATADPKKPFVAPQKETVPPYLNFAPLMNAVAVLNQAAARYREALNGAERSGGEALAHVSLAAVNQQLIESERKLTNAKGLPNRPWYKHEIYAPGYYTGYAVKTIPAVREAIEQRQWDLADEQIGVVSKTLEGEAALIDSAASDLGKSVQ